LAAATPNGARLGAGEGQAMTKQDFDRFRRAVERLCAQKGRTTKPTPDYVEGYFDALERFPIETVLQAGKVCRDTLPRFPTHPEWIAAAEAARTPEDDARVAARLAEARALLEDAPTESQIGTPEYQQGMARLRASIPVKRSTERKPTPYARKQYSVPGVKLDLSTGCLSRKTTPQVKPKFDEVTGDLVQPPMPRPERIVPFKRKRRPGSSRKSGAVARAEESL
jgi:hypothetical protein